MAVIQIGSIGTSFAHRWTFSLEGYVCIFQVWVQLVLFSRRGELRFYINTHNIFFVHAGAPLR